MILNILFGYFLNCFILVIPVFVWNIIFISVLPKGYYRELFWKDISPVIGVTENILRIVVFISPLFMQFSFETTSQKVGLAIYLIGLAIYFLSWTLQIYYPKSTWSRNIFGFMAPAFTPIIWLIGISLIGNRFFSMYHITH